MMMKTFKYNLMTVLAALLFVGFAGTVYAQSQSQQAQAVKIYNKAIDLASAGKYQQAINMYSQVIAMSDELGTDGQNIVSKAKNALPRLYYQRALNIYKEFQQSPSVTNIERAISAFETAVEMAGKYGNSDIASQAKGVINQLYYQKSVLQYRQGNLDAALTSINTAIERNPDYAQAYYQKALIIKDQESTSIDEYLAAIEKAVNVAETTGNSQIAQQAKQSAGAQLIYLGAQQVQQKNYEKAISLLQKALTYNPESADAYFRLAQAYNAQGAWNKALEAAQTALQYANGGAATEAKFYYAIGSAYQGMGQYSKACDAFSNATYGQFKQSAEHIIEFVLECK